MDHIESVLVFKWMSSSVHFNGSGRGWGEGESDVRFVTKNVFRCTPRPNKVYRTTPRLDGQIFKSIVSHLIVEE